MFWRISTFLAVFLCAGVALAAGKVRTWTNTDGRTMQAEFVRELDGEVTFIKDGKLIVIPLEKLSPKDQQAIKDLSAGKEPEEDPFTTPPAAAGSPPSEEKPAEKPAGKPDKPKKPIAILSRTWTDRFGTKSTGKFVRMDGNDVVIRGSRVTSVAYGNLSDADQEYVREVLISQGKEDAIPSGNAGARGGVGGTAPGNFPGGNPGGIRNPGGNNGLPPGAGGGLSGPGMPALPPNGNPGQPVGIGPPGGGIPPGALTPGAAGRGGPGSGPGMGVGIGMPPGMRPPVGAGIAPGGGGGLPGVGGIGGPMGLGGAGGPMGLPGGGLSNPTAPGGGMVGGAGLAGLGGTSAPGATTTQGLALPGTGSTSAPGAMPGSMATGMPGMMPGAPGASGMGNSGLGSFSGSGMPAMQPASLPPIHSPSFPGQIEEVFECSKCKARITKVQAAGTTCPHCQTVWGFKQDEFGNKTMTAAGHSQIGSAGFAIVVFVLLGMVVFIALFVGIIVAIVKAATPASSPPPPVPQQRYY